MLPARDKAQGIAVFKANRLMLDFSKVRNWVCLFFVRFRSFWEDKSSESHEVIGFLDESDSGIFGTMPPHFPNSPERNYARTCE